MSNTSSVSPYDGNSVSTSTTSGVEIAAAAAIGIAAVVGWLCQESAEDRAALERLAEIERSERLGALHAVAVPNFQHTPVPITTVPLHLKSPETLVGAAAKLGYRSEPLSENLADLAVHRPVLMRNAEGHRLAITTSISGGVQIQALGDRHKIDSVVRQHTFDQVTAQLVRDGMQLQVAPLANGEVQVLGREQRSARADGKAMVRLQVRADGRFDVDVDCVQGRRCEQIVGKLAEAAGGKATAVVKKSALYEEPGEPVQPTVKV